MKIEEGLAKEEEKNKMGVGRHWGGSWEANMIKILYKHG